MSHVLIILIFFFISFLPLLLLGFAQEMCIRGKLSMSLGPLRSRFQDGIKGTYRRENREEVG